jgi:hypothetical protein
VGQQQDRRNVTGRTQPRKPGMMPKTRHRHQNRNVALVASEIHTELIKQIQQRCILLSVHP